MNKQKPVAKVVLTQLLGLPLLQWTDLDRQFDFKGGEYLYAEPPSKPWVSLTGEEIDRFRSGYQSGRISTFVELTRTIEAKLKERNT